jgi:hypothetical protein
MNLKTLFYLITTFILTGCGTTTPIPAQGGGKRFAVEQALISASARKSIAEIPINRVVGKQVLLEISVIQDEGGGAITSGGRPYASQVLSAQRDSIRSSVNVDGDLTKSGSSSTSLGLKNIQSETSYLKDITYNGSDSRQFRNLVTSLLLRNNVKIASDTNSDQTPDYLLEIIVDVFGIWRSRTDWFVNNAETLMATTSFEYVLTPLNNNDEVRLVKRVGFDATYKEFYRAWIGPYKTEILVTPSVFSQIIGDFGQGSGGYSNLISNSKIEFARPPEPLPLLITPHKAK